MMRLYDCVVTVVSKNCDLFKEDIKRLPSNLAFDVYYSALNGGSIHFLCEQLGDLDVFLRLLVQTEGKRWLLHRCFQKVIISGYVITNDLEKQYLARLKIYQAKYPRKWPLKILKPALALGTFLNEGGWFVASSQILEPCLRLYETDLTKYDRMVPQYFDSCVKLLEAYNGYCRFGESKTMVQQILDVIERYNLKSNDKFNVAQAYVEFSRYYFLTSQYDLACSLAIQSLHITNYSTPVLTLLDVLRNCSRTCVIKRQFKQAELFIKQALLLAKDFFDLEGWYVEDHQLHPLLGELFSDYAFYLQNADVTKLSVKCYQIALNLKTRLFYGTTEPVSCYNLQIASCYENLAYACYVNEYVSGNFKSAEDFVDSATKIMDALLPEDHLLQASVKRVKALIMEEIALDHHLKHVQEQLLENSEKLHLSALGLARSAFGEMNVQTAKHYGNLGRLYQSMRRYDDAEMMHLKAIAIKETLLGMEDYEVALSLGHLASLYNYDLCFFEKAEKLYLRSISIGTKLFGPAFSGLEYDYRGLLRVYTNLDNREMLLEYTDILDHWTVLRAALNSGLEEESSFLPPESTQRLSLEELHRIGNVIPAND